ncbi:hypothetical protein HZH66_000886 [Vespula vulgaris]|uniref:Uncharacterized protein n=1 Tax=Vespula vulgaris TaxID=7454 RepID=A0A834NJ25_VESVU|nr:hypothetical protein HZH66_000886 [Vespula vulgaris]
MDSPLILEFCENERGIEGGKVHKRASTVRNQPVVTSTLERKPLSPVNDSRKRSRLEELPHSASFRTLSPDL